jgi:tetratricopeptide (TPR) repeat protein
MVLSPWSSPEPLTRAWCLWELFCTIETGSDFSVCLGSAERAGFEKALLEGSEVILEAFARIDVRQAQAGSESDRVSILAAAKAAPGGIDHQNAVAIGELRNWVKSVLRQMAVAVPRDATGRLSTVEAEEIARHVANGLWKLGEYSEAAELREAVAVATRVRTGPLMPPLGAMEDLAASLAERGETTEAKRLYREAIEGYSVLDPRSEDPATTRPKLNLAIQLQREGGFAEARALYTDVLATRTALLGAAHLDTLRAEFNMASLCEVEGGKEEAKHKYEAVVEGFVRELGSSHPDTLTAQTNLAGLNRDLGNTETATEIYAAVVAGLTSTVGADHVITLNAQCGLYEMQVEEGSELHEASVHIPKMAKSIADQVGSEHMIATYCKSVLGLLLLKQGDAVAAEATLREVLATQVRVHGPDHPNTCKTRARMQIVLDGSQKHGNSAGVDDLAWSHQRAAEPEPEPAADPEVERQQALAAFFADENIRWVEPGPVGQADGGYAGSHIRMRSPGYDAAAVPELVAMGFTERAVVVALEVCGDKEEALELLTEESKPAFPPMAAVQAAMQGADMSDSMLDCLQGALAQMQAADLEEMVDGDEDAELAAALALSMQPDEE